MTDHAQMMKRQQVLADFGEFAIRSEDFDEVLTEACRLVGDALGTGRAKILEIREDRRELLVRAGVGWAPDVVGRVRVPMGQRSSESYSINAAEPVISRDIDREHRFDIPEFMKKAGVVAFVNVPIFVPGQQPYGVLQVDAAEPREFGDDEVQFLRTYAMILGPVIDRLHLVEERARASAASRTSEEQFRTLFQSIEEGLAVVEMIYADDGTITDIIFRQVNSAYERQTGIGDAVGRSIYDIIPDVEDYWIDVYQRVATTGESARLERYQQDVDMWFDVHFTRVDDAGRFVAIVFNNTTERRKAEETLRQSEERQRFLLKLSDILQRLHQPNDMKAAATQLLGEHLNVSRAQYHEVDSTGVYYGADGIGYSNGLPLLDLRYRIDQFGSFVGQDFEAGRPFRSDDLLKDPRPTHEEREAYVLYEIRAGAGAPLLRGGKLVAILAVHDKRPHAWTDLEMELIRETAERIWVAVERARSEVSIREGGERQRFMLTFSDALRAEPTADAVARRALQMLSEQLQLDRCYLAEYRLDEDRADITHQTGTGLLPPMPDTIRLSDFPEAFRVVFDDTLVIDDVAADERLSPADQQNILGLSMRALLAPTLRKGLHRPLWVIVAASGHPRHWTPGEIALAEEVAERTWLAVERARGEAALRESEERFQQFARASAAGLWMRDASTMKMEFISPAMVEIYGANEKALSGEIRDWAALIVPEDRTAAVEHIEAAQRGQASVHQFRIQRPSDGSFRWIRDTAFPLQDGESIDRVGGIAEDISETRQLLDHQEVLLAELQHRVRNIMGMIRSMANRTAPGAKHIEEYRSLLEGRLLALARVQALLTRKANTGGSLRDIVHDEVAAQAHHQGQFELIGADTMLAPKAVEVLTLAFHELATNALKYGALSVAEGRLTVSWVMFERRGRSWLSVDWIEAGAPARKPSTRKGFGSELIEARIPYELGGTGKMTIESGGARCHMEFPLKQAESILETDAPLPPRIFGGTLDMTGAADLTGRTVLVVEDDYYMARDTAAALSGAGAEVLGPCPSEETTFDLLEDAYPTHAVLDLNLGGGGPKFAIAEKMMARGIPFIFLTGYDPDVIPPELSDVPRLQKPVPFRAIVEAVALL